MVLAQSDLGRSVTLRAGGSKNAGRFGRHRNLHSEKQNPQLIDSSFLDEPPYLRGFFYGIPAIKSRHFLNSINIQIYKGGFKMSKKFESEVEHRCPHCGSIVDATHVYNMERILILIEYKCRKCGRVFQESFLMESKQSNPFMGM